MEKMLDIISREVMAAMEASGYDGTYGKVTLSNRPDLCEYQCNGAMAAAGQEQVMSTLDVCDIDLYTGKCEFVKVGGGQHLY